MTQTVAVRVVLGAGVLWAMFLLFPARARPSGTPEDILQVLATGNFYVSTGVEPIAIEAGEDELRLDVHTDLAPG
jgi:hypothetical protein